MGIQNRKELYVFADASTMVYAAAIYLKEIGLTGE
jgi:hypothetical protein